jgi:hypothetical protein
MNKDDITIGFIILRHVRDDKSFVYWILCHEHIRKYYPDSPIMIIDDNSSTEYCLDKYERELDNTIIIQSEYPGRGELLPYYYYLKNKFCDTVCILHDSVFVNRYVDFGVIDTYKMLWQFEHWYDSPEHDKRIISVLHNNSELLLFYDNNNEWKGCFGGMSVITYDYLKSIDDKYDITRLISCILNRPDRSAFERVIGCLLQIHDTTKCFFGDIYSYCKWGINMHDMNRADIVALPFIKVWSGR